MRSWSYTNHRELGAAAHLAITTDLHIVRMAPGDRRLELDFVYEAAEPEPSRLKYCIELYSREDGKRVAARFADPGASTIVVDELVNGTDYVLKLTAIVNDTGEVAAESPTRLVRLGLVPGIVVNYIHPEDYTYDFSGRSPASPSITILPDGRMLASHDVYWQKGGQNLTMLFESTDAGRTWRFLCSLYPCFWGKLFQHRGSLYMLATSTEYGDLLIGRSDDGGRSWSSPSVILRGGSRETGGPHKAPVPIIVHKGRIWSAIEYGAWAIGGHDTGVISASVDADLLEPSSWTVTPFVPYDPDWPGTIRGGAAPSLLEGNVAATPEGNLINLLRYHTKGGDPDHGRAIMLQVDDEHPERPLSFGKVIDFHGNLSKFTIQYDPVSARYLSLVSRVTTDNIFQRNVLTLVSSADLEHWDIHEDVLNYQDNGWPEDDKKVGFQYVDWAFQGEDIVFLSRTALNGAFNYHNANYITFHRIEQFRQTRGR